MIVIRYLTKEVFNTLFSVTLILILAFISQQVVRYLNYVAVGKIPTDLLLQLISFEIPYLLAILLPLGLYIGILLCYGRLYADNEMAVLNLSGFGRSQLLRLTLGIAFAVALIVLFLMLWVNPLISAKRQQLMSSDKATLHLIQTLIPGRFQVSPDGRHVMYVEKLSRDHRRAQNVFLAEQTRKAQTADQNVWMLVHAKQGYQMKDHATKDNFFVTTEGYRYEGIPGQNDYKITQYKKYFVRIPPSDVHITHQESEMLPTLKLLQQYNIPKNAAELQWRISIGILTLMLALLALPMSAVSPRKGKYWILLPAIIIYVLYMNLLLITRHFIEQSIIPSQIGMWWVHGVALIIILSTLFLTNRRHNHKTHPGTGARS